MVEDGGGGGGGGDSCSTSIISNPLLCSTSVHLIDNLIMLRFMLRTLILKNSCTNSSAPYTIENEKVPFNTLNRAIP